MERKLYRLPEQGKLAGAAAGFAEYMGMDVTLMRLIFVAIGFLTGGGAIIAYIVLAIVLPAPDEALSGNVNVGAKVEHLAEEMKTSGRAERAGNYVGIALVLFGVWLLIGQIFPGWFSLQWSYVWPLLIILFGVWIITKGKRS